MNRRTSSTNSGYLRSPGFAAFQHDLNGRKSCSLKRDDLYRQSLPVIDDKNLLVQTGFHQRIRNQKTEKKNYKISLDETHKRSIQLNDTLNNNKVRARKQKVTLDDMIKSTADLTLHKKSVKIEVLKKYSTIKN